MKRTILATAMMTTVASALVNNVSHANDIDIQNMLRTNQEGIVNTTSSRLNLRKSASINSEILAKLSPKTKIYVLSNEKDGWYKVKYNSIEGYVSSDYVKIVSSSDSNVGTMIGKVKTSSSRLNVRSNPSTSSAILGKLSNNELVNIIKDNGDGWYKINYKGTHGYVSKSYVVLSGNTENADKPNNESTGIAISTNIGKIATVNATSLNIRTGAGTNNSILSKAKKGDIVKITDAKGDWYKVDLANGTKGWCSAEYLNNFRNGDLSFDTEGLSSRDEKIQKVVSIARSKIGKPYVWGAEGPNSFDCSGLTWYCYKNGANVNIPRTSSLQATYGKKVSKSELQIGDLVFFNTSGSGISHVGIYTGNNKMIHSPRTGKTVEEVSINSSYWTKTYVTARRIL